MIRAASLSLAALALTTASVAQTPGLSYPDVTPGSAFSFPADHGAHPDFRTEWWYVTGTVKTAKGKDLGFQITFFRTRPRVDPGNPSKFAPRQVLFAHAAVSDPAIGKLLHDQRAARSGFGIAEAKVGDADVRIKDWRLVRLADGRFSARIVARGFALKLIFMPTQRPILQGAGGYSRKGAEPQSASYYYSLPQLETTGTITRGTSTETVKGRSWLDREWSSRFLGGAAVGWDWTGLNFDDGAALMAFRIRGKDGRSIWAGGTFRRANGTAVTLKPGDITFTPTRTWRSRRTGATYPVAQILTIKLPEGQKRLTLAPMFADQELDARSSGLPVYWEGLVRTEGGRGYLELTGYAAPLVM
ncbi:lipocalin-like domain-containing protein [Blastomonas fulva]|uniref:lipocalin-like domain-containing protein n=1 Tax=Blastomonas fulva TaxID=1550728 RepID=UPI003D2A7D6B